MDPFAALTDTVFHQGMELKHVQTVQSMHADRLLRIEKKQADDAALKSVWTSPFPSVLTGTPNQGAQTPYTPHSHASMTPATGPVSGNADVFEDFDDEHCQSLLTSLHLDEDPIPRRGASRANSVRFDVSAIQGSGWGSGHAPRPSNDFGPVRPNSAFGLSEVNRSHSMERSMSHKSEGRHSSAGHSIHSGRTSSLGLTNHFSISGDHEDDDGEGYGMAVHAPPPGLFVLGTVPTIIRCWLNENFSHSSLLYCVVCTGSQRSTITMDLVKDLGLGDQVQSHGMGGASPAGSAPYIRLPVYLPEAVVTQPSSRPCSPGPQLPTLTVTFDVLSDSSAGNKKAIPVFLGSDTLRAHSADLLLSQNKMALNGDDGNRLSVPFVRPEDESVFKNIVTGHAVREKVSLKGTAAPFTPAEKRTASAPGSQSYENEPTTPGTSSRGRSPTKSAEGAGAESTSTAASTAPKTLTNPIEGAIRLAIDTKTTSLTNGTTFQPASVSGKAKSLPSKSPTSSIPQPSTDRDQTSAGAGGIWTSWRSAAPTSYSEEPSSTSSTSGYKQPPSSSGRSVRSTGTAGSGVKVLKPTRSASGAGILGNSKVGTGASYEPPTPTSPYDESRRKSGLDVRWEDLRKDKEGEQGGSGESKGPAGDGKKKMRLISGGKTANPIGTASAFSWMKPSVKPGATSN